MASIQPVGKTRGTVLKQIKTAQREDEALPEERDRSGFEEHLREEINQEDHSSTNMEKQGFAYYDGGNTVRVEPADNHAGVFPGLDLESKEIVLPLDEQQQVMMRKIFGFDSGQGDNSGLDAHGLPPSATQHDIWNSSGPDPTEDPRHLR